MNRVTGLKQTGQQLKWTDEKRWKLLKIPWDVDKW